VIKKNIEIPDVPTSKLQSKNLTKKSPKIEEPFLKKKTPAEKSKSVKENYKEPPLTTKVDSEIEVESAIVMNYYF